MKRYIVERVKLGAEWPGSEQPGRVRIAGYFKTRDDAVAWMQADMEASRTRWPELGWSTLYIEGKNYCCIGCLSKCIDYAITRLSLYEMLLYKLRKMRWIDGDFPVDLATGI